MTFFFSLSLSLIGLVEQTKPCHVDQRETSVIESKQEISSDHCCSMGIPLTGRFSPKLSLESRWRKTVIVYSLRNRILFCNCGTMWTLNRITMDHSVHEHRRFPGSSLTATDLIFDLKKGIHSFIVRCLVNLPSVTASTTAMIIAAITTTMEEPTKMRR